MSKAYSTNKVLGKSSTDFQACKRKSDYCNDDFLDFFCSKLREGYPVQARFEKDGKLYVTYAWVEIKDDVIDVFIGNSEKEAAIKQVFKNYHPFEYGKYGVVDLNK